MACLSEIKRETLLRSIAAYDRQLLDDKKEVLKKDVSRAAFISGLVALAPVPGVSVAMDLSLVAGISKQWYKTFGIDRESLQKTAMDTGTDISELQKIVDDENTSAFLTKEAILNFLLKCGSAIGIAMAGEEASRLVLPVLGSIIACPLSAYSTHKMLMYILEKMHGTAVKVVEFANKNITA